MLQINEYNLVSLDSEDIDKKIKRKLKNLESNNQFKFFFSQLNKVINSETNFSFVKASHKTLRKLIKINTHVNIDKSEVEKFNKNIKNKDYYTLNDILEILFGYHLESHTQVLKKFFKTKELNNCVYCFAQHTTSYIGKKGKFYVKGNLDHIFPKSINALVSLSVNNLIPVCAHCNQRKLNADLSKFNFNPFDVIEMEERPTFKFKDVLEIENGELKFDNLINLKIENINTTLEGRLELTSLYQEYESPITNLLERYKKFNSSSYKEQIQELINKGISGDLEYFISETPFTEENIHRIPLHKFKNDFYKELEEYKKIGTFKFEG